VPASERRQDRGPVATEVVVLFKVLGPLEVELAAGDVVVPGGAGARALLAALLLRPGAVVPVHRLAEAV
jgi:DNA-binding SARP family transcriptional activator